MPPSLLHRGFEHFDLLCDFEAEMTKTFGQNLTQTKISQFFAKDK